MILTTSLTPVSLLPAPAQASVFSAHCTQRAAASNAHYDTVHSGQVGGQFQGPSEINPSPDDLIQGPIDPEPHSVCDEKSCSEKLLSDSTDKPNSPSLIDVHFDWMDFSEAIDNIPAGPSPGPHGVPAVTLKRAKVPIARLMCVLFRKTMDKANIPDELKTAFVLPVFRSGSKVEAENYGPISLTSHLMKSGERVIRKCLLNYLEFIKKMNQNPNPNLQGNKENMKIALDAFLSRIPDEPKCPGLVPGATDILESKPSNKLISQVPGAWRERDCLLA
jgi:hypothetical protein